MSPSQPINFGFPPDSAILITGAGSGIGRATALAAAQMGLSVSAWDINEQTLNDTVSRIQKQDIPVHSWVGDVGDYNTVTDGMASATKALGPINYLHNNAGPPSSIPMDFDEAVRISLGSMRTLTNTWAQSGLSQGAAMVITASVAGNLVGTDSDWYSSSKAALVGYTRHLAAHRAAEFRTNAVGPGMTDTPRLATFKASEMGQQVLAKIPLKRMATGEDIAFATLFLLSPLAGYINGVFLPIDGGWTVTQ